MLSLLFSEVKGIIYTVNSSHQKDVHAKRHVVVQIVQGGESSENSGPRTLLESGVCLELSDGHNPDGPREVGYQALLRQNL